MARVKTKAERVLDSVIEKLQNKGFIGAGDTPRESLKGLMLAGRLTPFHFIRISNFGPKGTCELAELLGLEVYCGRFVAEGTSEVSGILDPWILNE